MRILLTGAEGQLGRAVTKRIQGTSYLATDYNDLDITARDQVFAVMKSYRPQCVIHCAAYTNVDGAEHEQNRAYLVNAVGTQNIAAGCLDVGAKMVYVSTDYVFDGKKGQPYSEYDYPNPINVYGKTKFIGEMVARQTVNKLFTVRTSWLYGEGNNFVRTMLKIGKQKKDMEVVDDQFGCPSSSNDVAEALLQLVETENYGIYHVANRGIATWHSFAEEIFKLAGYSQVKVNNIASDKLNRPAQRPSYSVLDSFMLELVLGYGLRDWQSALREYLSQEFNLDLCQQEQVS